MTKCCICKQDYKEFGNNAEPIMKGRCCDKCNAFYVISARLKLMADRTRQGIVQNKEDIFDITFGNLQVLKAIPEMMLDKTYRKELRKLTLNFIMKKNKNRENFYL